MASDNKKVSIITATYKKFDKIFGTIDSVFAQDYPCIEYIITDDGSDNFPREQIEDYIAKNKPERISYRIIHHEKNMGTVKNLNNAYRASSGEYLLNLSCGDVFFDRHVVSRIIDRFQTTKCDVLVTSRLLYKDDFEPVSLLPHYAERSIIQKHKTGIKQYRALMTSRFYDMASGSAMYFTKDILEKMGYYDENYVLWEDGPFLARFLLRGKLEFAYDIVSIWYEAGGVSYERVDKMTGDLPPEGSAARKMLEDTAYFNSHEKTRNMQLFSPWERRLINYRNERFARAGKGLDLKIYLKYFPELAYYLWFSARRRKRTKDDRAAIQEILNEVKKLK